MHFSDRQVLEITCLKRFLFGQDNVLEDPDQGL
jgi:hypothetical protein